MLLEGSVHDRLTSRRRLRLRLLALVAAAWALGRRSSSCGAARMCRARPRGACCDAVRDYGAMRRCNAARDVCMFAPC
eukprot:scaffold8423_cov103-Isochrysis_galbana.AAC.1